ncbi:bile acid:sodium symporter family protein [Spirochaetota bacterium]
MDIAVIDQVRLNFNQQGILAINAAIGIMMLGVALDLKLEDFKRIIKSPRAPAIGLAAQFILLPAFTFLLTCIINPAPSIALGMIMVAACPGGNLSNLMTYLAKGNTAVSISMTAVSTMAAIIMTPLNLSIWGSLNPSTAVILKRVHLSPVDVFITIFIILGIPMALGMTLSRIFPNLADRVRKPFKIFSLVFFILIVVGALGANWQNFLDYVGIVMLAVLIHNFLALNLGFWSGKLFRLKEQDVRAVSIEVGIQNSALGWSWFLTFSAGWAAWQFLLPGGVYGI